MLLTPVCCVQVEACQSAEVALYHDISGTLSYTFAMGMDSNSVTRLYRGTIAEENLQVSVNTPGICTLFECVVLL